MKKFMAISLTLFFFAVESFAQQWQTFTIQNSGLPSNNVFAIGTDEFGTMWFGTDSGITAYDGTAWYTYSKSDGLADNSVNDLIIKSGPELWLATHNGISAMTVPAFETITMSAPFRMNNTELLSNRINVLAFDSNNALWFGTDSGVTVFTGSQWIRTKTQQVVLKNDVTALAGSPDAIVYCGTEGGGVARLKLGTVDVITGASTIERPWVPVPIDSVNAIYIGGDGLQWFGTPNGLFQHSGIDSKKNWKMFTPADGLPHRHVQAIMEDGAGKIWVGTVDGVACVEKDLSSFLNYSTADGLAHNNVRDIVADAEGSIWFATTGGVTKFSSQASSAREIDAQIAGCFDSIAIYPNPFNSCTTIEFKLQQPAYSEIAIYNLSGQQVRTLWQGNLDSGAHMARWDGRDAQDSIVSSGIYFARLVSGKQSVQKKLLVLK